MSRFKTWTTDNLKGALAGSSCPHCIKLTEGWTDTDRALAEREFCKRTNRLEPSWVAEVLERKEA